MKMRITPQAKHFKFEYYITYLSAARLCALFHGGGLFESESVLHTVHLISKERLLLTMHVSEIHTSFSALF